MKPIPTRTSMIAVALLALSACDAGRSTATETDGQTGNAASAAAEISAADSARLAAAEPFEALTEGAATAPLDRLDVLIDDVKTAAAAVSVSLRTPLRGELNGTLAIIDTAREENDRTGIALAAVEGYRTLIESMSGTGKVPKSVSLLDYAGFRYQADLAAGQVRWQDARAALDFADQQWAGVSRKVADSALRDEFAGSLSEMRAAAEAKDAARAGKAATHELDLVDELERYFELSS